MAQSIQTSKFGTLDTSGRVPVSLTGVGSDPALGLGLSFNVGGKDFTFIPEDRITQGAASGSSGALFTGFLNPTVLSNLQNASDYVDLSGVNFGTFDAGNFVAKNMGGSTKGYLAPKEVVDPVLSAGITQYDPSFAGKPTGIGNANGKPAYILPSGYADDSGKVTKSETKLVGYRYSGGGGLLGGLSDAFTQVFQPIEQTVSQNLGVLDKDLSLSQNAPLIAAVTAAYLSGGLTGDAGLGESALASQTAAEGSSGLLGNLAGSGLDAATIAEGFGGTGGVGVGGTEGLLGSSTATGYGLGGPDLVANAGASGFDESTISKVQSALNDVNPLTAARSANFLRKLFGGTGMATTAQQGLGSLLGGLVQGAGGLAQGGTSAAAAEEQARMISQATGQAVGGSQFRPIGTTTRFGTSQFQVDPTTGQLTSAGYQLTPELKAMQDRVMALTGQGLTEAEQAGGRYAPLTTGAQGLFGLGQQYLAQSPQQVAADYMAKQQDLLAPSRERQLAQLQTQLFNTGRGGLSVGGTGMRPGGGQGLRASSPEMEAYYNALAQQDAQLAAGAQQAGQQQVQFGAGLMGTGANLLGAYGQGLTGAYAPFSTGIGVGTSLEALGQQPFSISQELAKLSSASGARAGELGIRGTTAAATARLPSMQYNPLARALVGAGGNTQFGNVLGQVAGNALPGLLGLFSGGMPTASDVYDAYGSLGDTGYSAADLAGLI